MLDPKPIDTPFPTAWKITKIEGTELPNPSKYKRLIGRLLYLTVTRPDIAFAIKQLSQFMDKPTNQHWKLGLRVLRYLKGVQCLQLIFNVSKDPKLTVYSDSD